MAPESGTAVHPLIRQLEERPHLFSFFRAVWLLEKSRPDAARLGHDGPARREVMRLRPATSMGFTAADVRSIARVSDEDEARYDVVSSVMGLYGATSPLPSHYSVDILRRDQRADGEPGEPAIPEGRVATF